MELVKYVRDILSRSLYPTSFPGRLDIPKALVDYCWNLYSGGERIGKEQGVNLSLDASGNLAIGTHVFQGTASGINITNGATNDNFGDLHCHPSSSVGHVNGYAAHSGEDFLAFRDNTAKPVFIRFVASGTHIYAAVYRSGHSILNESLIVNIRDKNVEEATVYFDTHCPVKAKDRIDAMSNMESSNEHHQYIVLRRRDTPGLGKTMERLSISACKEIANKLKFGFYAGDQGYGVSVWYFGYLRLHRQAP
jgi:hypothetical protein